MLSMYKASGFYSQHQREKESRYWFGQQSSYCDPRKASCRARSTTTPLSSRINIPVEYVLNTHSLIAHQRCFHISSLLLSSSHSFQLGLISFGNYKVAFVYSLHPSYGDPFFFFCQRQLQTRPVQLCFAEVTAGVLNKIDYSTLLWFHLPEVRTISFSLFPGRANKS